MPKTRIVTRVKDKTGIAKSKNRSEDLKLLRERHTQFSKNLKFLITTIQSNHDAMQSYSKSRLDVAKAINALTVDTPLFKCGGDIPASAIGTTDGGGEDDQNPTTSAAAIMSNSQRANSLMSNGSTDTSDGNPTSFAAVHLQLHKKSKMYHRKYIEHILSYASDWERILSTRVNKHIKHADKLRVDLDHYQKKVEELNKDANKTMNKGKNVSDKGVDKLKRNEQKLVNARREHDQFVADLCGFMEEIMERGWKDLHPLLVKMAQFDITLSGEEAKLLSTGMVAVVGELKALAGNHPNMNPTGRLKELETWSLETISKTNPRTEQLTITGGDEFGVVQGASADDLDVGGGGLFGSAPNSRQPSSDNLYNGGGSDSFGWNTGVAPESQSLVPVASAPSSYGLPPLPRQGSGMTSPSHNSMMPMLNTMQAAAPPPTLDDIFGAAPAQAPVAPPPAMMPPPPPPQSPQNMGTPMYHQSSPMVNSSPMMSNSPMMSHSPMTQPPTMAMNQMSLGGAPANPQPAGANPFGNNTQAPMMNSAPAPQNLFGGNQAPAPSQPPTNPFDM